MLNKIGMNKIWIAVVGSVVLIGAVGGGLFLYKNKNMPEAPILEIEEERLESDNEPEEMFDEEGYEPEEMFDEEEEYEQDFEIDTNMSEAGSAKVKNRKESTDNSKITKKSNNTGDKERKDDVNSNKKLSDKKENDANHKGGEKQIKENERLKNGVKKKECRNANLEDNKKEEDKIKSNQKKLKKGEQADKIININTASASELAENLKGIGEAKAEKIVSYRQEKGKFLSIEEIKNVKGIGDKIFEGIKERIVV